MKKFLLSIALVLFAGATMAQSSLQLTFTKKSATDATVNAVNKGVVNIKDAAFAVSSNFNWKSLVADSNTFPNASMLCPDKNTKEMTPGNEGVITIAMSNMQDNDKFKSITFTSVALNGEGKFQSDNAKAQHVDFILKQDNITIAEQKDIAIKVNSSGGATVAVTFTPENPIGATNGNLTLSLNIVNNYAANGCFYGLIKVDFEYYDEYEKSTIESCGNELVTASDLMARTVTSNIVIKNVAQKNNLYFIASEAPYSASMSSLEEKFIFTWEPAADGKFYLKKANAGYLQNGGLNTSITFGEQAGAAIFHAVTPVYNTASSGAETAYGTDHRYTDYSTQADDLYPMESLVRFVNSNGVWVNTQEPGNQPKFNKGTGAFTLHAIYNVIETEFFDVAITDTGVKDYATFYTPIAVTIPEGVKAYYINDNSRTDGCVDLVEIADIIPAKTAVILEAEVDVETEFRFIASNEPGTAVVGNMLTGSTQKVVVNKNDDTAYYILTFRNNNVVGFAVPTKSGDETIFDNAAFKAYLSFPKVTGANYASFYSFRFNNEGTTTVEEVEIRNEKEEIYDLTGRKLEGISGTGIYIINGKKVLVK